MNLLIIKPSSLGDIIQGMIAVQSIKDQAPQSRITWVARDRFAPFVRQVECVDRIIEFKRDGGLADWYALYKQIHAEPFDAVLDMQGLFRSGLMTAFARSPLKIGRRDAREGAQLFCNRFPVLPPKDISRVHILLNFLPLLGLKATPAVIKLKSDAFSSSPRLPEGTVLIFPSCRGADRVWPHFRALTEKLLSSGIKNIAWASDEALSPPSGVLNLSPNRDLAALPGLISQAAVVVANDSGPAHMAAALGKPLVALYGPTDPRYSGPFLLPGVPSHVLRSPTGKMVDLGVEEVLNCSTSILVSKQ